LALGGGGRILAKAGLVPFPQAARAPSGESLAGQRANLAGFGELKSWINPELTPLLPREVVLGRSTSKVLRLSHLAWKGSEFDVGVEWPEFRTVEKVVIRFAGEGKAPRRGRAFLEYWNGPSVLQGAWAAMEDEQILGQAQEIDGSTWSFAFSNRENRSWIAAFRRTSRLRLRLQEEPYVEIAGFEIYGPSEWRSGEVHIAWGYGEGERSYDGSIECYNGEVMGIQPSENVQLRGPLSWSSTAGGGKAGGIVAKVLYTSGLAVDRTSLTLRTKAGTFSFLPAEAIEDQPIDIPDFGFYIRKGGSNQDRASYLRQNAGRSRIMDAVSKHPEQALEGAYEHIRPKRVTLSFIGVDSNNQKFGIAPDGHLVVGSNDPSHGLPMTAKFAVYFDSTDESATPAETPDALFSTATEKHQELEEGWLPIITTRWNTNDLSLERMDYAVLHSAPDPLVESRLRGDELALMISRLKIRNDSPAPISIFYYIKPWKPANGGLDYGPMPANIKNAWQVGVRENHIVISDGASERTLGYVDTHDRGTLTLEPAAGAACYSVKLEPGDEHVIHHVIPGLPLVPGEGAKLQGLPYEALHDATAKYWQARLAEGMQIEVPDAQVQNLFKASLHHWLLVLTKDAKRGEYYPNTAMLGYGSIGSESSPVLQAMDMLGLHERVKSCLEAWLSTQGDSKPEGDYGSKEGGFFHFWPNYTIDQGGVLWSLAEHYLYTRDKEWLRKVAPQIVAGCDFLTRERQRMKKELPGGRRLLSYGLAPAGCVADMRDWQSSFMLNGYFYLGLKKSAQVLEEVDPENAKRIEADAADYLAAIRKALKESVGTSPVTRLRDDSSVPSVPPFPGLRGFRSDVKDIPDPGYGAGYGYDVEAGPFHLLKSEVLEPHDPETTWMLNYLEDRFFLESLHPPGQSMVPLDELSTDWFNQGGFAKLQPYYLHCQDAYLRRDEIPQFLRAFYNTLATSSDAHTLTFRESMDEGQPHKTHEEGWFFQQLRCMLAMERGNSLYLAWGTPRAWLEHGKRIAVNRAATYFGELSYSVESSSDQARIEATVKPPRRNPPGDLYLRLRHPKQSLIKRVTVGGRVWTDFDRDRECIKLPTETSELKVIAYY
jgi:hypothetical protein